MLVIPRVCCKACGTTHAVIPAFLFAYVRYPATTLSAYIEQSVEHSRPPIATWTENLANGPHCVEALYRWMRRLRQRLSVLIPFLESELLKLDPAFDLSGLQKSVLKSQNPSSPQTPGSHSALSRTTTPSPRAIVSLCTLSYWLSQHLLQLAGELLKVEAARRQSSGQVLSPVAFLNYFCWQKLGVALISSPAKPRAP